jgi:hypothetical protein
MRRTIAVAATAALALLALMPVLHAQSVQKKPVTKTYQTSVPASYYRLRPMRVPVAACLSAAERAVRKSKARDVPVGNVTIGATAVGGYTFTTHGYIVCVRRPGDGCNGDGATAVIITAGADAQELAAEIDANLEEPTLFDCPD